MRYRNRVTGVIVRVADGKQMAGPWEPADTDRQPSPDDMTCPDCGFVAKSRAGLGAHRRRHTEG